MISAALMPRTFIVTDFQRLHRFVRRRFCCMTEKSYSYPVRVYWEDTDAGGIVYHANYLRFMERARTEFLRSLGLEQRKMQLEGAPVIVVSSLDIKFVRSAVLDDALIVQTRIKQLRRASIVFEQTIVRGEETICKAQVRCASVDMKLGVPTPTDARIMALLETYASEPEL